MRDRRRTKKIKRRAQDSKNNGKRRSYEEKRKRKKGEDREDSAYGENMRAEVWRGSGKGDCVHGRREKVQPVDAGRLTCSNTPI